MAEIVGGRNCKEVEAAMKYFVFLFLISTAIGLSPGSVVAIEPPQIQVNRAAGAIEIRPQGQLLRLADVGIPQIESDNLQADDYGLKAGLKTDPDLEASLETADRFRRDGNYRVATQIWQVVLQRSGDALYSEDGEIYFSLAQKVETILASLPAEGLAAYRVTADAEARQILAAAGNPLDVNALSKIVRFYFVSSMGEEAAYRLGLIYLDQHDFIGARRMFQKVLTQFPDPKIPQNQVQLRLAVCHAFLGQTDTADGLLNKIAAVRTTSDESMAIAHLKSRLSSLNSESIAAPFNQNWLTDLKDRRRYGVMAAPPESSMSSDLMAVWQFYVSPNERYSAADAQGNVLLEHDPRERRVIRTLSNQEEGTIKSWRSGHWRPSGLLLFAENRLFFKAPADATLWDTDKIEALIEQKKLETTIEDSIAWRSVWRNAFEVDEATRMAQTIRRSFGGMRTDRRSSATQAAVPETVSDIQFFQDQIYQQASISHGLLFSIEGPNFDRRTPSANRQQLAWNASFRRSRSNFLSAYDLQTGMVKWVLPRTSQADDELVGSEEPAIESEFLDAGGFMGAPIDFGNLIIAPVNQNGAISVYAFDPFDSGKTVWKSFLCDEPESGAEANSPIQLSLEGSDLFVNVGMGVVFVLEPATGLVRFARRYQRVGQANPFNRRNHMNMNRLDFKGWSSDVVIPYGRQMICFSSDTDLISSYDRNNGELIWRSDIRPLGFKVDYLLGVYDDILYAAGQETILAYDLQGEGRMIWGAEQMFDGKRSLGKGMLTPAGLFIPVEDSIYHFSLATPEKPGKLLARVGVDLGTRAPVGNLFSNGRRIWVHGGNRVYALDNLD